MWDERYAGDEYAYGTTPNEFLVSQAAQFTPGDRVLDLGAGEGRNAVWLAARGCVVTAVDQSAVGLHKAERLAAERGVAITTVVADLVDYEPGVAQWDAVVSIFCHLPSAQRRDLNRRVAVALRPGGVYVAEYYTPAQLAHGTGGPRDPDLLVDAVSLRADLASLEVKSCTERVRPVREGAHHRGEAAVVQCVARRPPTE